MEDLGHCRHQLPADIWKLVWDKIESEVSCDTLGITYAMLASVCRDWQLRFEPVVFQRLRLRAECLERFGKIVNRVESRRSYIRNISFRVLLPLYPRGLRFWRETDKDMAENSKEFTRQVTQLFRTLNIMFSGYDFTKQHRRNRSMELDFVVSCDSDCDVGDKFVYVTRFLLSRIDWDEDTMKDELGACAALPKLPVVDVLSMQRASYRSINPKTLSVILSRLPRVNTVILEPWAGRTDEEEDWLELAMAIPKHVQTITACEVFSSFDGDDNDDSSDEERVQDQVRTAWNTHQRPALAEALVRSTAHLKHLSVSNLIDARHFLADFWPGSQPHGRRDVLGGDAIPALPRWDNLRFLTLTAAWRRPRGNREDITDALLIATARAAKHMPRLQMLQVYSAGTGTVINRRPALLRYEAETDDGRTELYLATAWVSEVSPDARRAWEAVAYEHARHVLQFVHESALAWLATRVRRQHDMHLLLKRGDLVVHPRTHASMETVGVHEEEGVVEEDG
ncbi:hypothetical protein PG989_005272 [Apiospora arundinis]|uniref:Oxoglutarate iron-dependent oxygenase n=1 Tax=Apiospora arundinis TaxID=335852 RepID=A0ABR2ITH8_9PEZI